MSSVSAVSQYACCGVRQGCVTFLFVISGDDLMDNIRHSGCGIHQSWNLVR